MKVAGIWRYWEHNYSPRFITHSRLINTRYRWGKGPISYVRSSLLADLPLHFARRTKIRPLDDIDLMLGLSAESATHTKYSDHITLNSPGENTRLHQYRHAGENWLETIRIGLLSGLLPKPARDFSRYWNIISSPVKPAYLTSPPAAPEPGTMNSLFDFRAARIRILSGLGNDALGYLLKKGDITDAQYRAAVETDPRQSLSVHLPSSAPASWLP